MEGGMFSQGEKSGLPPRGEPAACHFSCPGLISVNPPRGYFWKRDLKCPPDISIFALFLFAPPLCCVVTVFDCAHAGSADWQF